MVNHSNLTRLLSHRRAVNEAAAGRVGRTERQEMVAQARQAELAAGRLAMVAPRAEEVDPTDEVMEETVAMATPGEVMFRTGTQVETLRGEMSSEG